MDVLLCLGALNWNIFLSYFTLIPINAEEFAPQGNSTSNWSECDLCFRWKKFDCKVDLSKSLLSKKDEIKHVNLNCRHKSTGTYHVIWIFSVSSWLGNIAWSEFASIKLWALHHRKSYFEGGGNRKTNLRLSRSENLKKTENWSGHWPTRSLIQLS